MSCSNVEQSAPFIPDSVKLGLEEFGADGVRWLEELPERIAALERAWGFSAGPAFNHRGAVSWTSPAVLREGTAAVLKIGYPHEEALLESEALRIWDGEGAVRLLRKSADGFTLLLERCSLGTDLWSLDQQEEDNVAIQLLPRLWLEPKPRWPFTKLATLVENWTEKASSRMTAQNYEAEIVNRAMGRALELAATQPQQVLLHGDFHPGNVLAAKREPWLAIDPKPVVGEPAYDLAQWLFNRLSAARETGDSVAALQRHADRFANELQLDPARIAGWALAKSVGWDCSPAAVNVFDRLHHGFGT